MNELSEDLQAEIEATLNQLLETSEALKAAKRSTAFGHEVEALENLQESLLARLMHRQAMAEQETKGKMLNSIRKEEMQNKIADLASGLKKHPQKFARVRKARSKS